MCYRNLALLAAELSTVGPVHERNVFAQEPAVHSVLNDDVGHFADARDVESLGELGLRHAVSVAMSAAIVMMGICRARGSGQEGEAMARVIVEVPDETLVEFIEQKRGLDRGQSVGTSVEIEAQPPVDNSNYSHIVTVSLRYALELGELDALMRP